MDVAEALLGLIAGIGVFLIACNLLSSNIEAVTGNKLRALFSRSSEKKLVGVGIGATTTAVIQSSGATSVLVLGFVNAGLMSLTLAAAIIYGANIGTTVTGIIVALGLQGAGGLSLITILAAITGVGAFMAVYSKKDRVRKIGLVLTAFGLLFVGLSMMKDAMGGFAEIPSVREAIASVSNLEVLILIGIVLTAIVQSSSVLVSVAITMFVTGLIDMESAIYLVIGSNIGSCVVALLASTSVGRDAKRIALAHLLFNIFGVCIFTILGFILKQSFDIGYQDVMRAIFGSSVSGEAMGIAVFDLIFNVAMTIIMLPLTSRLLALTDRIVPKGAAAEAVGPRLFFVNDQMLKTPVLAIGEVKNEIVKMLEIAMSNVKDACHTIVTLDLAGKEEFDANEKQLNFTNKKLTSYITKLSAGDLPQKDRDYLSTAYHSITDIERIGDYAVNIRQYAERIEKSGQKFSSAAVESILDVQDTIEELHKRVVDAYVANDRGLMKYAHEAEQEIDAKTEKMGQDHVQRLQDGRCSADVGAEFLMMTSDLERIADHLYNVAKAVKGVTPKPVQDPKPDQAPASS